MDAASATSGPPESQPSSPRRPSRLRRVLRAALVALISLLVVLGVAVSAVLLALGHLEHPWVKPVVLRNLREALALPVDYRTLSVSLRTGRVRGTGLVIAQPPRFEAEAEPFVRVREANVDLDLWDLIAGEVRISRAVLDGLEMTYVADETTDSVSLLFPTDPSEPVVPLSGSLSLLRGLGVDVARIEATSAAIAYVELEEGRRARSARLDALALRGHLHETDGQLDVQLDLAPSTRAGTAGFRWVQSARAASSDGTVGARDAVDATARIDARGRLLVRSALDLSLGMRIVSSSGLPVAADPPFEAALDLGLAFDERGGHTRFDLRRLSVYGDVLSARLDGIVDDASTDVLRDASGRVDLAFEDAPFLPEGIDAHGVRAQLLLDRARLSPAGVSGGVDLQASAERASMSLETQQVGGEGWTLSLQTLADVPMAAEDSGTGQAAPSSSFTHLRAALSGRHVVASDAATAASLEGRDLEATLTGPGLILATEGPLRLPASSTGAAEADVLDVRLGELSVSEGRSSSARLAAPALHAEGVGLVGAMASNAPADGRVAFEATRLEARSGADRVDLAPLEVEMQLHAFLREASGLFGLGGRADVHVGTSGSLRSGGELTRLRGFAPVISADFDRRRIDLGGRIAHLATGGNALSLPSMDLHLSQRGDTYAIQGRADVTEMETSAGRFGGRRRLELEGQADLRTHVADLDAHLRPVDPSDTGPSFDASLHASIDPETSALDHRLELETHRLAPALGPYLPEGARVDFSGLRVEGSGRWANLFARPPRRGQVPELGAQFLSAMEGEERLEFVVEGFEASRDQQRMATPRAAFTVQLSQRDGGALAELDGRMETVVLRDGADEFELDGFRPRIDVRVPDASRTDVASVHADVAIARIRQALLPGYPVSDVSIRADVDSAPGELTLRELVVANAGGHGTLRMTGAYEQDVDDEASAPAGEEEASSEAESSIDGREALSVTGELTQELGPLAGTAFARQASGRFRMGFEVQSGDLRSFHGIARFAAEGVDFTSADGSLVVERLNGEIPVVETVTLLSTGPVLDPGLGINALSRARFPDVQPFLNTDAYLTSQRIEWQGQSLGPIAGNVRVEGTTLSVDRLQMGYRGGSLTGQLEADLMPGASHLSFRGNATGIHTARGGDEVLDANMAIRFVPETLSLDGSMQLVRVSRSHLTELLDGLDPYHEDDDFNTVRTLLRVGYPRFVRLRASEGLLDFEVDLGGLASAIRIEPIRAIPIAPLLEEYAFPIVDALFPRAREHVAGSTPAPANEPPRENDHE